MYIKIYGIYFYCVNVIFFLPVVRFLLFYIVDCSPSCTPAILLDMVNLFAL